MSITARPREPHADDLHLRERELAALSEIAAELAGSMRDSDQVLNLIVRRARRLLASDLAYITVPEPDGAHARIRVVDGNVTAAFGELRLKLGLGLGGVVASTRMPYAAPDTTLDPAVMHDDRELYRVAKGEGIVAVAGVPLIRDQVIGVLYLADRVARSYTSAELALLSSLADHAVVALNNAYLFEEADASIRALQQARDELAAKNEAMARLTDLDDVLILALLEDVTAEGLARRLAAFTGAEITIADETGSVLGCGGGSGAVAPTPELVAFLRQQGASPDAADIRLAEPPWPIGAPFGLDGAGPSGVLMARRANGPEPQDYAFVERAALVVELLLTHLQDVTRARQQTRDELVYDLISERNNEPELRQRTKAARLDLDSAHVVVVLEPTGGGLDAFPRRARNIAISHHGIAAEQGGRFVMILPCTEPRKLQDQLQAELSALGLGATGFLSHPVSAPVEVRDAFVEADRCLSAMLALGREGQVEAARELGFFSLLLSHLPKGSAADFATTELRPLLSYDERHESDLVATAEAFLQCRSNVSRTARNLHVHPNTVYKRLARIGELLGSDWSEEPRALQLLLATNLRRLAAIGPEEIVQLV